MRSLWAGVTGLQAHQVAMDVEGNNIANVNTTGYKYSRANFSDLLSQTAKIATAPQGQLGGKNAMQIGLGTQVSTVTKIFKQGSIETTDKTTDLAIQGDGFFVVSPDGGSTYKYTRSGDFTFDANGNFVDTNGYIAQGWNRDKSTLAIDSTSPIANITISPGLTTPANASSYVSVKANLDSGSSVGTHKSVVYSLDANHGWVDTNGNGIQEATETHDENDAGSNMFNTSKALYERGQDFGALFNSDGNAFSLTTGQGVWTSFAQAKTNTVTIAHNASGTTNIDLTLNGETITGSITSTDDSTVASYVAGLVNAKSSKTGVTANITGGTGLYLTNDNQSGTEAASKNIKLTKNGTDTTALASTNVITAYQYTYTSSPLNTNHSYNDGAERTFTTTEDLREALQKDARLYVDYSGDGAQDKNDGVTVTVNKTGQYEISNPKGDAFNADDGDVTNGTLVTPVSITANTALTEDVSFPTGTVLQAGTILSAATVINGATVPAGTLAAAITLTSAATIPSGSTLAASGATPMVYPAGTNFKNANDYDLYLTVTNLTNATNNVASNTNFSTTINALQGTLTSGSSVRTSQSVYAATHASSIDVYDSLGSKHTVRLEYTKTGFTSEGGTEWSVLVSVPEPGDINLGNYPANIVTGTVSFNSDGSLATYSPRNLTYTANNGSTGNQNIELKFGTLGQFDGMTSFDKDSNTSGISQDGYAGGDLNGLSVDETGTVIGSFTNGRSFALAQVAMATFTNNQGLESDGGNCFIQTSNSGDPIVGQASTGGKGTIQASSLEMSNVDLSRSLTQLIVIQRGYQANSKTITTADEMLNTLLQLK
jgi:flagellar hook protein FlgE